MRRISHHDTLNLREVMKIGGDLLLLPRQVPLPTEEARALQSVSIISGKKPIVYSGAMHASNIARAYCDEREMHGGREPNWIASMPVSMQSYARMEYALTREDAFQTVLRFSHTGISYMILNGGLCEDTVRIFNLFRLNGIKQLGFLQVPIYNNYMRRAPLSEGTRLLHSLDVMAIATLIGHNLRLNKRELNTLRVLALTHDVATPAGGDSVKIVDLANLDEDQNYAAVLSRVDFAFLEKKYDLDRAALLEGIFNRGLLGEILDIADKLAYIARDIELCRHHLEAGATVPEHFGLRSLLHLIEANPYFSSIWDSVRKTRDGRVYFADSQRLTVFLKIRLLQFREVYYHPASRFGEFLMSRVFVKMLYDEGKLTSEKLQDMDDGDLLRVLNTEFGTGLVLDLCSSDFSRVQVFRTIEEARVFIAQLKAQGKVFYILDDNTHALKTGTQFLVRGKRGIEPLYEADPRCAQELQDMATMLPMVHVYYLEENPRLPREPLDKLLRYMHDHAAD